MPVARSSLVAAALGLVISLSLVGCSGSEDVVPAPAPSTTTPSAAEPSADSSVDASADVARGLEQLYAGNSALPQDRGEAACFADELHRRLSDQDLVDAGILQPDGSATDALPVFDETTAAAWVDAQLACVGFIEASTRALLTQTRGAIDADAYATCLRTALTDGQIRAALVQTLSGGFDSPEVALLADAQAGCTS